jgi:hypothetical protein
LGFGRRRDRIEDVTEERNPVDQLLDLFLFAPVGMVLEAREHMPELVERGRRHLNSRVAMARAVGELAVRAGEREAQRLTRQAVQAFSGGPVAVTDEHAPSGAGRPGVAARPSPQASATGRGATGRGATGRGATGSGPTERGTARGGSAATPNGSDPGRARRQGEDAPDVSTLAVPAYDTLSAPQVVQRLPGLSPDELEELRRYESATRGRRTILNRIAQLQNGD